MDGCTRKTSDRNGSEAIESLISTGKSKEEVFGRYIAPTFSEKRQQQQSLAALSNDVQELRNEVQQLRGMIASVVNGTTNEEKDSALVEK